MSDVFVSHVEEDADIALKITLGLEEAGYATWCYEVDNIPGPSYLLQTGNAIQRAKAIVLVISPHSLGSNQITREVVRGHETGTFFVPVLHDITHEEFQVRQPEWREALGASSSIHISGEVTEYVIRRIVAGLKALGVEAESSPDAERVGEIRGALSEVKGRGISGEAAVLRDKVEIESEHEPSPGERPSATVGLETAPVPPGVDVKRGRVGGRRWGRMAIVALGIVAVVIVVVWAAVFRSPDVLFSDDFNDPSSGWEVGDWGIGWADYQEGCFHIEDYESIDSCTWSNLYLDFSDFVLEVETRLVAGTENNWQTVYCRCVDDINSYDFSISADGYYQILLWRDGESTSLTGEPRRTNLIKQGQGVTNLIRVECDGSKLSMYVNGCFLVETTDDTFSSGYVGLGVASFEDVSSEVAFDNLVITAL